jgi:hypothetical protein
MHVMMFTAKIKPEHVSDVESAVKTMFAALEVHQPKGVKYASSRASDVTTFIILLALENPSENPLPAIQEFRTFQDHMRGWLAEPTAPEPLTVVGSYGVARKKWT